jgi:hypothetical protein
VLKINGPNFGVSGGRHAADEALLVAATLLAGDRVPGVWLVLTGYDPEPIPEKSGEGPAKSNGRPAPVPVCRALALALVAARPGPARLQLHASPGPVATAGTVETAGTPPWFRFEALLAALHAPVPVGAWRLHCGGSVELKRPRAGAENGL